MSRYQIIRLDAAAMRRADRSFWRDIGAAYADGCFGATVTTDAIRAAIIRHGTVTDTLDQIDGLDPARRVVARWNRLARDRELHVIHDTTPFVDTLGYGCYPDADEWRWKRDHQLPRSVSGRGPWSWTIGSGQQLSQRGPFGPSAGMER